MFGRVISGTFVVFATIAALDSLSPNGFANPTDNSMRFFTEADFGKGSSVVSTGAMRVLDADSSKAQFFPLGRVKINSRNSYCWFAFIKPGIREVKVDEMLILPSAPKTWGTIDPAEISKDRTTHHRIQTVRVSEDPDGELDEGLVYACWTNEEGDPEGLGEIRVRIDEREVGRFPIEFFK